MAKIEKMFGAILKDQEQKSDDVKKQKGNSSIKKEAPDPLMQVRSFLYPFFLG